MRAGRVWWAVFGVCAVVVLAALAGISGQLIRLEQAERGARADAARQEALRLALWRMDSWVAPELAREASRQYFDYLPFHAPRRAYTRLLHEIREGEVLTPSPLLSFESAHIGLHFQVGPDGAITSPQVPTGNLRDLAEGAYLPAGRLAASTAALETVRGLFRRDQLAQIEQCVSAAETATLLLVATPPVDDPGPPAAQGQDLALRKQAYYRNTLEPQRQAQQALVAPPPGDAATPVAVTVGPLVPVWSGTITGGDEAGELLFVRRVRVEDGEYLQGFVCAWAQLRDALLAEIADLFPGAALTPALPPAGAAGAGLLATIPAQLVPGPAVTTAPALVSPVRATIVVAWLAVLAGLVAVAITLRASIAFGEKRSRFASAVTHELRTPLTTFRMYSEMLAEGMVRDDEQRRTYLATLRDEADRLATLVERILAYARLERGAGKIERSEVTVGGLLDRLRPALERQTVRDGMALRIEPPENEAAPLSIDVDTVEQILFNLVENAGKHAGAAADRAIDVRARVAGGNLLMEVADHGPGIDPRRSRSVFAPFERGADGADAVPGVGLGLALARGLARSLGGDLRLRPRGAGEGACFELRVPTGR